MNRERQHDAIFKVHRTLMTCVGSAPYAVDEPGLFQSVCDILVRSGLFQLAWFGYAAGDRGRVGAPITFSGDSGGFIEDLKLALGQDDYEDPATVAIRTGDTCWIMDLAAHPGLGPIRPAVLRCGLTSVISVPLMVKDNAYGALTLYYDDPEQYGQGVVSVLKEKLPHVQAVFAGRSAAPRPRSEELEIELRGLIDALPLNVGLNSASGNLIYLNRHVVEYSGHTMEDWVFRGVRVDYDYERVMIEVLNGMARGAPFVYQSRQLRQRDQQYRWHLVHVTPIRDEDGQIIRWCFAGIDIEDLKQAEDALRARERDLTSIINALPTFAWSARPDGYCDFLNQGWLDYAGLTEEQAVGWGWGAAIHPDDAKGLVEYWQSCLASGTPVDAEARMRRFDGEYRWFLFRANPLRDESGNIVKWYGTNIDIEDRKKADEKLRQSEADLLEAQRLSHTGSWKLVLASGTVIVSPEVRRIFGVKPDRALSNTDYWLDRNHPEDAERVKDLFETALTRKTDYEADYRIVLPDGTVKHLHAVGHPVLSETGDLAEFVGTVIDVTAAKQAEDKIRQSEREARQLLDLSPLHITLLGPGGDRVYANQAALDYYGLTLEEWQDVDFHSLFHPEDAVLAIGEVRGKLSEGSPFEYEARLKRRDGQYRWFHSRFSPISDEQGRITRWYVAGTDIHDRKVAEQRLLDENVALREEIDKASMFEEIVGTSEPLKKVLSRISRVAPADSSVLITGETGTGKELVARAIHRRSQRSSRPFVSVNCAAIPRDLIGSELFGHEKGAFTGATQRRSGRFELAEKGTIFLDEVGELPAETQVALLRVLQEREFERIGGTGPMPADVRVVAATNRDLEAAITAGTFRSDLYYRLNVFPIEMPTLRERNEDIPLLVTYFLNRFARKAGRHFRAVDKQSLELLQSYPWPGNIRELQNVIERSVIVGDGEIFSVDESWLSRQPRTDERRKPVELSQKLAAQEKEIIEAALRECGGRVSGSTGAAARLGMPGSTLESKIKSLKIDKNRFRTSTRG